MNQSQKDFISRFYKLENRIKTLERLKSRSPILTSPDGSKWRISINNTGDITTTKLL